MTPEYNTRKTFTNLIPKEKLNTVEISAESNDKSCYDKKFVIVFQP